jgi:tRNA (guanine-N7-)-methyltransferase
MDFAWEALTLAEREQAYADWTAGKGLLGGDPRQRPGSELLPAWGIDRRFFRVLTLDDDRGWNGSQWRADLATSRPLEIEVGFGRGDFILDRAIRHPQTIFLAYEVKTKAVRLALSRIERLALDNLWLSDDDTRFSLPLVVPDGRADVVHILFPDPWWKKQHHIKRIFSPPFVDLLAAKLKPGGLLHFKSDVQDYGELVRYLVAQHPAFRDHDPALADGMGPYVPTHREAWCGRKGLPFWSYYFQRK